MTQRSLIWPLSLIAAFATMVVLLLIAATPTPSGAQEECTAKYPVQDCNNTATSVAKTTTAQAYPEPSNTPGSSAPQPSSTPTLTTTATLTVTRTAQSITATLGPTRTPTATRAATQGTPTATATSPLSGLETIPCAPGSTVTLSGEARPSVAILVYFNDRPVGGALARWDGRYMIMLRVGDERPGIYPVDLRERDSRVVVRELACEVPGTTPTPTRPIVP